MDRALIMLTIRDAQLEAFREPLTRTFLDRLADYLVAAAGVSPDSAPGQAESALASAREFNLTAESEVAEFARIVCLRLGGFPIDSLPRPAQNLLLAYGVSGADRLGAFDAWLSTEGSAAS